MATIGGTWPTLADLQSRLSPDGKSIAPVMEMLNQTNEILVDMPWIECNKADKHETTQRASLPSVGWRTFNSGVPRSKSTVGKITATCGMMEANSEVDVALAELAPSVAEFRLSESRPFVEAMNQEMASTVFYGSIANDPKKFDGLYTLYNTVGGEIGQNVLDAGGSGTDNTSIWLVEWSDQTVHGIYPKGTMAGLQTYDRGQQRVTDANGDIYDVWSERLTWKCGLALRDWRYVVRVANIDISNLESESSAADLMKLMIKAMHRRPAARLGRSAWYMNERVATMLDIQAIGKANLLLTYSEIDGKPKTAFRGVPIRRCDQILSTEARVV